VGEKIAVSLSSESLSRRKVAQEALVRQLANLDAVVSDLRLYSIGIPDHQQALLMKISSIEVITSTLRKIEEELRA
jgi:hypothetical protein